MKPLIRQYLLGSALIIFFIFAGIYWIVGRPQKPVDSGTQLGKFWMPALGSGWSKRVSRSSDFEMGMYGKKLNNSAVVVSFERWLPSLDGTSLGMDDLKKIVEDRVGKKDIKLQFHETNYHTFQALVSHKSYITQPVHIENVPGWNGTYGKGGTKVEQRTIQILCPPDRYTLAVTLFGQNPIESQVFAKSVWESIIENVRFLPVAGNSASTKMKVTRNSDKK